MWRIALPSITPVFLSALLAVLACVGLVQPCDLLAESPRPTLAPPQNEQDDEIDAVDEADEAESRVEETDAAAEDDAASSTSDGPTLVPSSADSGADAVEPSAESEDATSEPPVTDSEPTVTDGEGSNVDEESSQPESTADGVDDAPNSVGDPTTNEDDSTESAGPSFGPMASSDDDGPRPTLAPPEDEAGQPRRFSGPAGPPATPLLGPNSPGIAKTPGTSKPKPATTFAAEPAPVSPRVASKPEPPTDWAEPSPLSDADDVPELRPTPRGTSEQGRPVSVADADGKFRLRYQFTPGETLQWKVIHKSQVRTTVSGTTQTSETTSTSVKQWRVVDVDAEGVATFVNSVESVDMRQSFSGRREVRYNSETDEEAPEGFQTVAESVGKPLSTTRIDAQGNIIDREYAKVSAARENDGEITVPFPDEAIAIGAEWSLPYELDVPLETGGVKRLNIKQRYTLSEVDDGIATIEVATAILTPIDDPSVEVKVIQRESKGTIRFDIVAGRIVSQQLDTDRRVHNFRGDNSSLHLMTRFTEDLMSSDDLATAQRPAGPTPR